MRSFIFEKGSFAWTTSTASIVMLGKGFISVSFAIIYNYTAELFPTVRINSINGENVIFCVNLFGFRLCAVRR